MNTETAKKPGFIIRRSESPMIPNTGLAGAVYSKDAERAKKVALAIETGQIFINQPSSAHPELPLGGIKNSGFGREMSDIGLFEFANEKIVVD